ncbi:hypothetical protein QLH51_12730 [Sphingomonas sp. 2R-10]|uniref:hypothetical protein n=1 Tax=Sphingomonas sp. 2R-10 TaxID=3045148 RepID=UPI0024BB00CF|nr:hypothetical protein [Sphingomonas sp. 2R-10]MDJ0277662.1 hypothetical protein [Sphingomonas sp. 2R-10]
MTKDEVDKIEYRKAQVRSLKGASHDEAFFADAKRWDNQALSDALHYGELTPTTRSAIERTQASRFEMSKPATNLAKWQKVGVAFAAVAAIAAVCKIFV